MVSKLNKLTIAVASALAFGVCSAAPATDDGVSNDSVAIVSQQAAPTMTAIIDEDISGAAELSTGWSDHTVALYVSEEDEGIAGRNSASMGSTEGMASLSDDDYAVLYVLDEEDGGLAGRPSLASGFNIGANASPSDTTGGARNYIGADALTQLFDDQSVLQVFDDGSMLAFDPSTSYASITPDDGLAGPSYLVQSDEGTVAGLSNDDYIALYVFDDSEA